MTLKALLKENGFRPLVLDGAWDGYTVEDDGSGKMLHWLSEHAITVHPGGRTVLSGGVERAMRELVKQGDFGKIRIARRKRTWKNWTPPPIWSKV